MQQKRRHHYLPRYFLGGFTEGGGKAEPLHIRSKKRGRSWTTRAEAAAHERDLFKPEGAQFDPDEFEDGFAFVESQIAPVLREVLETQRLPDANGLGLLLHLVALNAARPPAEIEQLARLVDENMRRATVDLMTPETHERVLREWRDAGKDTTDVEDLEAVKKRILAGGVRAVMQRDHMLVMGVLGRAAMLIDLLSYRQWTIFRVEDPKSYFICSDRPVTLLNSVHVPMDTPARFDDARFDVIMPLSKKLCMVGHAYGKDGTATASVRTVGFINHITETAADDFIYSATESYFVSPESEFPVENGEAYRRDIRKRVG